MDVSLKSAGFTWTRDCGGKEDFDGPVLSIESRIYPRGGSHTVFDVRDGKIVDISVPGDPRRSGSNPSGGCRINVLGKTIIEKDFEAETTEELKAQLEAWATSIVSEIV